MSAQGDQNAAFAETANTPDSRNDNEERFVLTEVAVPALALAVLIEEGATLVELLHGLLDSSEECDEYRAAIERWLTAAAQLCDRAHRTP